MKSHYSFFTGLIVFKFNWESFSSSPYTFATNFFKNSLPCVSTSRGGIHNTHTVNNTPFLYTVKTTGTENIYYKCMRSTFI